MTALGASRPLPASRERPLIEPTAGARPRPREPSSCPIGDIAWCCRSLSSWKAVAGDLPRPFTFQSGAALGLESRSGRLLLGQAHSRSRRGMPVGDISRKTNCDHVLFQTFANANARIETTSHDVTQSVINHNVEHNLRIGAVKSTQPRRNELVGCHAKRIDT